MTARGESGRPDTSPRPEIRFAPRAISEGKRGPASNDKRIVQQSAHMFRRTYAYAGHGLKFHRFGGRIGTPELQADSP
jgi:hypothetical protein